MTTNSVDWGPGLRERTISPRRRAVRSPNRSPARRIPSRSPPRAPRTPTRTKRTLSNSLALFNNASHAGEAPWNLFRNNWDYVEKPRSIMLLIGMMIPLVYLSYTRENPQSDPLNDALCSAGAMIYVFLIYCCLMVKDGLLVRPHPMYWRLVHGIALVYLIILAGLLVNSVESSRRLLQLFFDDIVEPADGDWEMNKNCLINYDTLYGQISSLWFKCHVIGWMVSMVMLRDWYVCIAKSIHFELMEVSLQYMIPDFCECWWDAIFIDVLGANLIGMFLGWCIIVYFDQKRFDWVGQTILKSGDTSCNTISARVAKAFLMMTPSYWKEHKWMTFQDPVRFLNVLVVITMPNFVEMNTFFLIFVLWIPASSPLPIIRLFIMGNLSLPALSEWYEYTTNPRYTRIGANTWLGIAILVLEFLVIYKFGKNTFPTWMPPLDILVSWCVSSVLLAVWSVLYFKKIGGKWIHKYGFYVCFLPLIVLCRRWTY